MESGPAAVYLDDVSVMYRVPKERVSGVKEYFIQLLRRRLKYEQFWALRQVSFQIPRGEVFGVIGRNGSGKSTLLKVMARVLFPTRGRLVMRGVVAPLLELGGGFHQELTGRENVFLNSALLGRSHKQTEALLPEIIEFAEIGEFMDAPLRTYSTGMVARLGFAVASCVRPDILLVDEVLSVGDAQFQQKCLERMDAFQKSGTTVIIVSHSLGTIDSMCKNALWLDRGRMMAIGPTQEVIEKYIQSGQVERETLPAAADDSLTSIYKDYFEADQLQALYPAKENLDVESGSLSVWVKINAAQPRRDAVIFHTDDSRYVLYMGSYFSEELEKDIWLLIGRAGGNRRAIDTFTGNIVFPEIFVTLDPDGSLTGEAVPEDQWHLVTLTWSGYPVGSTRFYWNGKLMGERPYSRRNDNGHPLPVQMAVGMRPNHWVGEILETTSGGLQDFRPESTLPVAGSGLEIKNLRLYRRELSQEEILAVKDGVYFGMGKTLS
jgi:ABC-type polysaccharide/polyol phosphate transport system ATPase subunit